MKKIFSKFTREREERFQIETGIFLDGQEKKAVKRPLNKKAQPHVQAMYENYRFFCEHGIGLFVKCEPFGEDGVIFEFAAGDTCYTHLLCAVQAGNKEEFYSILSGWRDIVKQSCPVPEEAFVDSVEFAQVFGSHPELNGKAAYRKLDIDLTLDNLVLTENGEYKIIDYEWIFDFPVPVEFMYYRAVLALYVRNGRELNAFVSQDSLFGFFGISESDAKIYEAMNASFDSYTSGGKNSLNDTLKAYEIKPHDLSGPGLRANVEAQVFISSSPSFYNADIRSVSLGSSPSWGEFDVDLKDAGEFSLIRLDPLDMPGVIKNLQITYTEKGQTNSLPLANLRHNALMVYGDHYVFTGEDPQMIWDLPDGCRPESVHISYEIEPDSLGAGRKDGNMVSFLEEGAASLKQELEVLKEKERRLAYIEGTSAYRMFLEKKVNDVFNRIK